MTTTNNDVTELRGLIASRITTAVGYHTWLSDDGVTDLATRGALRLATAAAHDAGVPVAEFAASIPGLVAAAVASRFR